MNNEINLSIDLDISARRIIEQLKFDNSLIEKQIEEGVRRAFKEIEDSETFIERIKESVLTSIENSVNAAFLSYDVKNKIQNALSNAIEEKLLTYSKDIATKISDTLDKKI